MVTIDEKKLKSRKGVSALVLVFLILTIALAAVFWYRANITAGTSQQDRLIERTELEETDFRLQNAVQYLQTSFGIEASNSSWRTANWSGRQDKRPKYRYWVCQQGAGGDSARIQIPPVDKVRETMSEKTEEAFEDRIEEVRGERNNYRYEVGDLQCVETGYKTPMYSSDNDDFKNGFAIEGISVNYTEGNRSRSIQDIDMEDRLVYNRMWYIYDIIGKWAKNNEKKMLPRRKVKKFVRDDSSDSETVVGPPGACALFDAYPDPQICVPGQPRRLTEETNNGLREAVEKLMNDPKYFGGEGISCKYDWNSKGGRDYPSFKIKPEVTRTPSVIMPIPQTCGLADASAACIFVWECTTSWYLKFTARLDYTLTCKDKFFKSVPREDLKPVKWKIDLSYQFEEKSDTDGGYDVGAC
ncbi:MAG: hypothetical protein SVV03_04470, partial [Candidatus Nanohaloarchaea archaeon]|nr:hypothetical protein [Candidatus Nanohaloarchaea archaeon]